MPRGQKSKARSREKRHQTKTASQELEDTQTTAPEKGESSSSSSSASGDAVPSIPSDVFSKIFQVIPLATNFSICIACKMSDKSVKGRQKKNMSSSSGQRSNKSQQKNLLTRKTGMLMEYMLSKYKQKEPLLR